jgi:predicted amidohydrolase YtcJ
MAAYTSGVAHQAGQADRWGRIAPGLRADLVLLDGDIDSLDAASLRELAVVGTWLGGRRVFGGA